MPRPFFPFSWGPDAPSVVTIPPIPPFWEQLSPTVQTWVRDAAGLLPRFQHLYPEEQSSMLKWSRLTSPYIPSNTTLPVGVDFVYHIQSQFPFLVNSDFPVLI